MVKKMIGEQKSEMIEKILIYLLFFWFGVEKGRIKKMNLYKFTYILQLKNDGQLKQKSDKQSKKKKSIT